MTLYFTADPHFGHANIIAHCRRPFADATAMGETLVANWNRRVGADDEAWVLGDFAFRCPPDKVAEYFHRLNGRKHLIVGNHDSPSTLALPWAAPPSPYHELHLLLAGKRTRIVLCHYALRVWNQSRRGALHLYGHSHHRLPDTSQSCDVGVDGWDFHPVTLDEAVTRMAGMPPGEASCPGITDQTDPTE